MKRSVCRVLSRGSRKLARRIGSERRTKAPTRALTAKAALTVARGQCRVREMYCGRRTSTRIARPFRRKIRRTVKVGLGEAKSLMRERMEERQEFMIVALTFRRSFCCLSERAEEDEGLRDRGRSSDRRDVVESSRDMWSASSRPVSPGMVTARRIARMKQMMARKFRR